MNLCKFYLTSFWKTSDTQHALLEIIETTSQRCYLTNNFHCCKINNTLGDWRKIITGVLQGSIPGDLLFNIFLNDIFFFLNDATLGNYADDSSRYIYNKNFETVICNLIQKFSMLSN